LQGYVYAALAGTGAFFHHPEALSLLSQAKDLYPTEPESDPNFALHLWGKGIVPFWEGLTLKRIGHYAQALTTFSRFGSFAPVAGLPDSFRAEHLTYAASVAVEQRDLETACLYLDAAEDVAWNIHHQQRQAEVRETFREVQLLWPYEPKVKRCEKNFTLASSSDNRTQWLYLVWRQSHLSVATCNRAALLTTAALARASDMRTVDDDDSGLLSSENRVLIAFAGCLHEFNSGDDQLFSSCQSIARCAIL
jgi:hypothetical protein